MSNYYRPHYGPFDIQRRSPAPTSPAPLPDRPVLKVADRCDQCGAQAFAMAAIQHSGDRLGSLLFCGHHYAKHAPALAETAVSVLDERHRINQ